MHNIPVDTRCCFNIYNTSRRIDILKTMKWCCVSAGKVAGSLQLVARSSSARNYSRFWKLCISIVGGTLSLLLVIKRIPSLGFLFILTTTDQCKLKQTKNLKWCKAMHYFKEEKERKKKDINRKMEKIYFMSNYICPKLIFRFPISCSWW